MSTIQASTSAGQITRDDILIEIEAIQNSTEEISFRIENAPNPNTDFPVSDTLQKVLATSDKLKATKNGEIKFAEPIISHFKKPIIYPKTINVIQGQAGSHKSRLAENICSALMKKHNCKNELLNFERVNFDSNQTVVYVDTERNISDQLPYALQSIQLKAGFVKNYNPYNFEFISLLEVSRKERYKTLNDYIDYLRNSTNRPLFIVLDVSTDCIEDFNKVDKSMELIDLLNITINQYDVTFLCLIHENPGSDKARGHFGTELMNKASTVMQVRFEKDAQNNDTELIKVKYLKCRSTERYPPFFIKYSKDEKGLVLASEFEIRTTLDSKKTKANTEDIADFLCDIFSDTKSMTRQQILEEVTEEFKISPRTAEDRIKEIIEHKIEIMNSEKVTCNLQKIKDGRGTIYTLKAT